MTHSGVAGRAVVDRVLRARSCRRMRWLNGGGETIELAIHPQDASLDRFDWRVSLATVASAGAFSSFAGIDRTLCVLDGRWMELQLGDAEPIVLSPLSEPLAFRADIPAKACRLGGPIHDLNVMTRRGRFVHRVERADIGAAVTIPASGGQRFVVCGRGLLRVVAADSTVDLAAELDAGDAWNDEGARSVTISPIGPPATAFLIHIDPVMPGPKACEV